MNFLKSIGLSSGNLTFVFNNVLKDGLVNSNNTFSITQNNVDADNLNATFEIGGVTQSLSAHISSATALTDGDAAATSFRAIFSHIQSDGQSTIFDDIIQFDNTEDALTTTIIDPLTVTNDTADTLVLHNHLLDSASDRIDFDQNLDELSLTYVEEISDSTQLDSDINYHFHFMVDTPVNPNPPLGTPPGTLPGGYRDITIGSIEINHEDISNLDDFRTLITNVTVTDSSDDIMITFANPGGDPGGNTTLSFKYDVDVDLSSLETAVGDASDAQAKFDVLMGDLDIDTDGDQTIFDFSFG